MSRVLVGVVLLLCALSHAARAGIVVFTGQNAFNTATNPFSVNFIASATDPSGITDYTTGSPNAPLQVGVDLLTFSNPALLYVVDPTLADPGAFPVEAVTFPTGHPILVGLGSILLTLPANKNAVSETVAGFFPGTALVTLDNGFTQSFDIGIAPNLTFIGFASDVPGEYISSISFDAAGAGPFALIDTVQYSDAFQGVPSGGCTVTNDDPNEPAETCSAPEPAFNWLTGLAIAGLLSWRMRRHRLVREA